jgi:hypothetical protein
MEVDLSPETEKMLTERAAQSGLTLEEFVVKVLQKHFDELASTEAMLSCRYDGLKSGQVELIPGDVVLDHFHKKSASARHLQPIS